jgi:hypothetical protein
LETWSDYLLRFSHYVLRITSLQMSGWLLVIGLLLTGFGGGFAPWVWRESVALQLTAPGLAEFVKFLPEIRTGQLQLERLYFLLPLFLAMLALPLFVENQRLHLPALLRWSLRFTVAPLALAALPPVWTPGVLMSGEFRLQTVLALSSLGLAVIAPLLRRLSLKALVTLLIAGDISAIILPFWQFSLAQTAISAVYHEPVSLGWGWQLTLAGLLSSGIGSLWLMGLIYPKVK